MMTKTITITRVALCTCICAIACSLPARAQQTREEERATAQAEKAKRLHPYEPTAVERRIEAIEKTLLNPPPFYPFIGSVYPGGWLAVGPGYRGRYAGSGAFDVHGAWSLKNYKTVAASTKLPDLAGGRVGIDLHANWIDAPKVAFYGIGDASEKGDRTSFLYRATTAGGSARIALAPIVAVGAGADYLDIDTGSGTSGTSIEGVFTTADTAGLGAHPTYTRSTLFAEVDWRESPGYTRSGGVYRVDWTDYRQTDSGPHSFTRVDLEAAQFIPLLRENWVIALRATASTTDVEGGRAVPYFLMPSLGGSSDLRGYPTWRFRDRHRILFTGEYRWMAGQFIDMALFLDAGKVTARRADLDLSDLRKAYGIGVRLHTPTATMLRIELAHSVEGTGLLLAFGRVF